MAIYLYVCMYTLLAVFKVLYWNTGIYSIIYHVWWSGSIADVYIIPPTLTSLELALVSTCVLHWDMPTSLKSSLNTYCSNVL